MEKIEGHTVRFFGKKFICVLPPNFLKEAKRVLEYIEPLEEIDEKT
ncbi:MAG: hypothetical protein ACHQYQ_03080 [Bacteriovoracales bacterium]